MFKLVEQTSGIGDLMREGRVIRKAAYCVDRYQGMMDSGLPIPGLHRLEGSVDLESVDLDGSKLTLRLESGQIVEVMADGGHAGRIFSEGHGPGLCRCC